MSPSPSTCEILPSLRFREGAGMSAIRLFGFLRTGGLTKVPRASSDSPSMASHWPSDCDGPCNFRFREGGDASVSK